MKLNNNELSEVNGGGLTLSATLFSSMNSLINTIFEVGQSFGTSLIRIFTGNTCSL